jgi:hypothetical protein
MLSKTQINILLLAKGGQVIPYRRSWKPQTLASLERRGFIFLYREGIRVTRAGDQVLEMELKHEFAEWREHLNRAVSFRKNSLRK